MLDSGKIKTPPGWVITDQFDCEPRPDVERWWVEDAEAPEDLNGKLVSVTISREGRDLDHASDTDLVYISYREVVPE